MTHQPNLQQPRGLTLVSSVPNQEKNRSDGTASINAAVTSERARQITIETASVLGDNALDLVMKAPTDRDRAIQYYIQVLREALTVEEKKSKSSVARERDEDGLLEHHSKLGGIAVFGLYQISPWDSSRHDDFHRWASTVELQSHEIAFALSFVREFEAWEPASPIDYALIIKLDRAVIRGARVGASSLKSEAFERWLEQNHQLVENGSEMLARVRSLLTRGGDETRNQLEAVARNLLREIGRNFGRSGLNSVRRQIGAPPSARRKSHLGIGAQFSTEVYALTEQYQRLKPGEREAFKSLLLKIDALATSLRR